MSKEQADFLRLVFADEEVYQIDLVNSKQTTSSTEPAASPAAEQEQPADSQPATTGEPPAVQGTLNSKVLVLINEPAHEFAEPGDQAFLQDILKAIKLSINEVALVNTYRCTPGQLDYLSQQAFEQVILFGQAQLEEALFPAGQNAYIIDRQGSKSYLRAETLEEIRQDRNKKMNLWNALKALFLQ